MPTQADNSTARAGLRPLNATEDGTPFRSLPAGVFGFTYAPLSESPLFQRNSYHSFEMQKLADGSGRLLGYVTAAQAAAIDGGLEFLDLYLYPVTWGEATTLVSLPVDRLTPKNRNPVREDGNRFAVIVNPARG